MFDSFFHNTFLHFDVLENGLAQSFLSQKPRRTSQKNQRANALLHSLQSYHSICITSANPQSLNPEDDVKRTSERRRFLKVCIFKRDGSQFFFSRFIVQLFTKSILFRMENVKSVPENPGLFCASYQNSLLVVITLCIFVVCPIFLSWNYRIEQL